MLINLLTYVTFSLTSIYTFVGMICVLKTMTYYILILMQYIARLLL